LSVRALFSLLTLATAAMAQQAIFDVPSADAAPRGGWFFQHQTVARAWRGERRWIQSNAIGLGAGHDLEIDATWYNLEWSRPGQSAPSAGVKWSPHVNEHLRFVAGELVQVRANSPRAGSWTYLMLSEENAATHTTFTGGLSAGTTPLFGRKTAGVLAGVEHHLLQADWFSGRHDLSYVIPGCAYRYSRHQMVSFGY